jgi:alpha-ketoglutarate-dependent taurine dioxygenase
MHSEMAYAAEWPLRIAFHCIRPATSGGATPIADNRNVFRRLSPELRQRFAARGVMYVRNYTDALDLNWRRVFATEDRAAVDRFCAAAGIETCWREDGSLQTRQVCPAIARHPDTGEIVWFNQVAVFHASAIPEAVRQALHDALPEAMQPRNCFYGDGSPIDPDTVAAINAAYAAEERIFDWQVGDVLLLDNMLMAHGRHPFHGPREVLVAMARPITAGEAAVPAGIE